jgi:lipopolysaccharide export system ATP-binding protein
MTDLTLRAIKLRKKYKDRCVVQDVSLVVTPGKIIGLLGPNGAGKTTCFYMIVGLIKNDEGSVWLANQNITALPIHLRARQGLGYLPQEASIFRKLTVEQNIVAVLESLNLSTDEQKKRKEDLLSEFNLTAVRHTLGQSLSGGERRRTEIARALASAPKFILLDEPFAGVDPISVGEIKEEIKRLAQKGIGILITDHNVRETLGICDEAYIMNKGQVIAQGSPSDILKNQEVRTVYLGEAFTL